MSTSKDHVERATSLNSLTERIIGCAYRVGRVLGPGFLERVYENALAHELRKTGLKTEQQLRMTVWYDGVQVGDYVADIAVEEQVIVEVKAARAFDNSHLAQCLNYLTATQKPLGLVINFSGSVEVRRVVGPTA
jgi:GxxExxY protein